MRIAVDTRLLQSDEMPEARDFTIEVFGRLTKQHPRHHFIFFIDRVVTEPTGLPENVTIITISQHLNNVLMYKWWYDIRLSLALGRYKADVFIGTYGLASLGTSLPQIVIVRDLSFLYKPVYFPYNSYTFYSRFSHFFIKRSKAIATLTSFVKDEVRQRYKAHPDAIHTIGSGINEVYKPVEWEEREAIKNTYAEGCEYFVFAGGLHPRANLMHTLKAFSIFKKWQKTNMKLVIAAKPDPAFKKDLDKLNSYKYRTDVFLIDDPAPGQLASIIAGAYALLFPSYYEGFALPVLAAMKCEVPVITSKNTSMAEIAGEAAVYVNPYKAEEIAEQMKMLFKDELLRNKLVSASKVRAQMFSWDNTASLLWKVIEETVSR